MFGQGSKIPASLAIVGSVLGLVFSYTSTVDYASHLDRRLHDVHCSFIPGVPPTTESEGCRAALYSAYSSVFRDALWGGIPISLFALGAFSFFLGFSVYVLLARERVSQKQLLFFAAVSVTPLLVSVIMFVISLVELGSLCKTCVGTYVASALLAVGGLAELTGLRREGRPAGASVYSLVWLLVLGASTIVPSFVYAASAPDHRPYLLTCGELKKLEEPTLMKFRGPSAVQPTLFFQDPLCPTCKAFHERLRGEGVLGRLDITLALFPLDNSCNWMLDTPLHPGSCTLSKAILCGKDQSFKILEWAFDEQEDLGIAGKQGEPALRAMIAARWGSQLIQCIDSRDTKNRLNKHLHFAAENGVPVSTPQVYLGRRRLCDEDTDIGLSFALGELAPEVLK